MFGFELGYSIAILDMKRAQRECLDRALKKQIHEDTLAAYEIARKQRETQPVTGNESIHESNEL